MARLRVLRGIARVIVIIELREQVFEAVRQRLIHHRIVQLAQTICPIGLLRFVGVSRAAIVLMRLIVVGLRAEPFARATTLRRVWRAGRSIRHTGWPVALF